ncbi:1406_t:CDS:2, partial [Dentiscutata heterogama]
SGNFDTIEKLLINIIKFTIQNKDKNFISNLSLMKIVSDNFENLTRYPELINWFLSRIAFFVPENVFSEIVSIDSSSSHLHKDILKRYYFLKQKNTTVKLVFPLMGFASYHGFNASPFAFSTKTNLYELWIGEALLNYKW